MALAADLRFALQDVRDISPQPFEKLRESHSELVVVGIFEHSRPSAPRVESHQFVPRLERTSWCDAHPRKSPFDEDRNISDNYPARANSYPIMCNKPISSTHRVSSEYGDCQYDGKGVYN